MVAIVVEPLPFPLNTWVLDSETNQVFKVLKEMDQTVMMQDEWLLTREVNKLSMLIQAQQGRFYIDGKGWSDGRQGSDRSVEPRSSRAVDPQQPVVPRPPRQPAPKQIVDGIRDALRTGIAAWNQGKRVPVVVSDDELEEDTQRVLTYLKDDKSTLKDSIVLVRLQRLELNLWRDKIKPARDARHEKREQEKEAAREERRSRGSAETHRDDEDEVDRGTDRQKDGQEADQDRRGDRDQVQRADGEREAAEIPNVRMEPAPFLKGFRLECSCGHKGLPRISKEAVMRVDYYKHELNHVKGKA